MRVPEPAPANWQILLADLSLILFITAAAAIGAQQMPGTPPTETAQQHFSALGRGDDLSVWLAEYPRDTRERLHITVRYRPGTFAAAMDRVASLERAASSAGHRAHITLEPAGRDDADARFAFDAAPAEIARLAQGLQK